jgi:hypothetical protein
MPLGTAISPSPPAEAQNLRSYLLSGGLLLLDDDYGFFFPMRRKRCAKIFPEGELKPLPR